MEFNITGVERENKTSKKTIVCSNCEENFDVDIPLDMIYEIEGIEDNLLLVATIKCRTCGCPLIVVILSEYLTLCVPNLTMGVPEVFAGSKSELKDILGKKLKNFDLSRIKYYCIKVCGNFYNDVSTDHFGVIVLNLPED